MLKTLFSVLKLIHKDQMKNRMLNLSLLFVAPESNGWIRCFRKGTVPLPGLFYVPNIQTLLLLKTVSCVFSFISTYIKYMVLTILPILTIFLSS